MKLKTILMMAIVTLCSVACSDDKNVQPVADSVAGTYKGTMDMTVAGNSAGSSDLSVTMTKTSDETVSMTIVNEKTPAQGMSINRVEIEGIKVTDTGNSTYALSKEIPEDGYTATDTGSANKIVWTFKSFTGSVADKKMDVTMVAKPGSMPMPITLKFAGSK